MNGRWNTDEDECLVLLLEHGLTRVEIAAALHRPTHSVYQRAARLGLSQPRKSYPGLHAHIRWRNKLGWSDAEIAAEWNMKHPDRTLDRRWLQEVRRDKLGLPHNAYSEHRRKKVAEKTQEQLRQAGLKSLAEVRVKAYRDFARRMGWPEDLRPRAVQILNFLYQHGPHTRRQIAEGIGMFWKGSRATMHSEDPEGSYLAHLQARGLVVRLGRLIKSGPKKGAHCNLYAVAPHVTRNLPDDPQKQQPQPPRDGRRSRPRGANVSGGAA